MKKMKANSVTIEQARDAAKEHFPENSFKFYWDMDDELWCCFKEGVDLLAANVFVSMLGICVQGLSTKIKIVDANSDFWE